MKGIRWRSTPFALGAVVVPLSFMVTCASCTPPARYESYRPTAAERPWTIKAEKSLGGIVEITINDRVVNWAQVPQLPIWSGTNEVEGQFEGHKLRMVLTKESASGQDMGYRVIVIVDGDVAARFAW